MENVFKKIDLKNYIDTLNNIVYGSSLISYGSESVIKEVIYAIEIMNKIAGSEVITHSQHVEGWEEIPVEGVYRILYTDRHNPAPKITEDDLNVFYFIKEVEEEENCVKLANVNEKLFKDIRKACKLTGVKFTSEPGFIILDGRKKSLSAYKQMQQAFNEGLSNISFDLTEINGPTIRTYASIFGAAVGLKIRCTVKDGFITTHFKEADPKEAVADELRIILSKASEYLSYDEIITLVHENVSNIIEETETEILEVEGLQQYVIPGIENSIDDDDF